MPPKAQNVPVPQDELDKLTASLVHLTQYIDENRSTFTPNTPITFPDPAHATIVSGALLKLALFTKKYTIAPFKATHIEHLLSTLIPALPLKYIVFYPVNIRNLLLDFTEILISASPDFATKSQSKYNFLYTCGEVLQNIDNQLFRGSYWHYATHCYRFMIQRGIMPHTGYPSTLVNLDPLLHKQPREYRALWAQLSAAALRDVTLFFQKPTVEDALVSTPPEHAPKPIEWRHIVYTIDIIVTIAMNSRLLHIFVADGDDFLTSAETVSTLRNIATATGLLIATLQELLNDLNGNTGCAGNVLTKQQQVQLQQLPKMLSQLYKLVIAVLSPNDLEEQDEFDQLKAQMKKLSIKATTTFQPTDTQRLAFQKRFQTEIMANIAPVVINDMILLINNSELQSDIFFLLLLVVELSYEHMLYFSLGHTTTTAPLQPATSKPTALSIIIKILTHRFSEKTIPAPFSTAIKTTQSVSAAHFLLSNEELVQFCCCMLDLIITALQQSTTHQQDASSDYSIPIRQLVIQSGIFTVLINFSNQIAGELAYIRAKQTHMTAIAKKGKKSQLINEVEFQYIPSYLIANRLFYIFASLTNFSHQFIVKAYSPQFQPRSQTDTTAPQFTQHDITNITGFLTLFTAAPLAHDSTSNPTPLPPSSTQYLNTLKSLFQLFNPCDIRDQEIFDNNETCDSLYCFLIHLQLYEHLTHFSTAITTIGNLADCKEQIGTFISTGISTLQSALATTSAALQQYETNNPIKFDKKTTDHYNQLLRRNMTILSMVDPAIAYDDKQPYTMAQVFTECGQLLNRALELNFLSKYVQSYSDLTTPPVSTHLPRAQPLEAFLSNLVNKTLHVDAVLQQNKEQLFDIGFSDDFDANGQPKPDRNGTIPEEEDEDEDNDVDEDDEHVSSAGFSFGGDDFIA